MSSEKPTSVALSAGLKGIWLYDCRLLGELPSQSRSGTATIVSYLLVTVQTCATAS